MTRRIILAAVLYLAALLALAAIAPSIAHAQEDDDEQGFTVPPPASRFQPPDGADEEVTPCDPDSGVATLVRGPEASPTGEPSNLWRYGVCGYQLHNRFGSTPGEVAKYPMHALASWLFGIAAWMAAVTVAAHQWAQHLSVSTFLTPVVSQLVTALRPTAVPLLTFGVAAGGVWALVQAMRGGVSSVFRWLVFTVAAATMLLLLASAPTRVIDGPTNLTRTLRTGMMEAAARAVPSSPHSMFGASTATPGAQPPDTSSDRWLLHYFERQLTNVYVHMPYQAMQFGSTDLPPDLVASFLDASAYSREDVQRIRQDPSTADAIHEQHNERYSAAVERLEEEHPIEHEYLRGSHAGEQVRVSAMAAVNGVLGSILHLLIGVAVLVADVGIMIVWSVALLALAVAPFGAWGRRVVVWLAGRLVSLFVLQLILSLLQVLDLMFSGVLLSQASVAGGYFAAALVSLVVTVTVWMARRPIMEATATRNVRPDRHDTMTKMENTTKTATKLAATKGAVAGGVVLGDTLSRRRRNGDTAEVDEPEREREPVLAAQANGEQPAPVEQRVAPPPTEEQAVLAGANTSAPTMAYPAPTPTSVEGEEPEELDAESREFQDRLDAADDPDWEPEPQRLNRPRPVTLPFSGSHEDQDPAELEERDVEDRGLEEPRVFATHIDYPQPERHDEQIDAGEFLAPAASPGRVEVDATVVEEPEPTPAIDWRVHRPPSSPAGMPGWPKPPDGIEQLDPQARLAHDQQRARVLEEWQEATRIHQDAAAPLPEGERHDDRDA